MATSLVLLLEDKLGCRTVQIFHFGLILESILVLETRSSMVPQPARSLGVLAGLLHLFIRLSRLFS